MSEPWVAARVTGIAGWIPCSKGDASRSQAASAGLTAEMFLSHQPQGTGLRLSDCNNERCVATPTRQVNMWVLLTLSALSWFPSCFANTDSHGAKVLPCTASALASTTAVVASGVAGNRAVCMAVIGACPTAWWLIKLLRPAHAWSTAIGFCGEHTADKRVGWCSLRECCS